MWGIPIAFLVGYVVARYFGDHIKAIAESIHAEAGKIIGEWF